MNSSELNFRVRSVESIVRELPIASVLDVGCRDCQARHIFAPETEYAGVDLFQNAEGSVRYVGDVMDLQLENAFDCVLALDMLEHLDDPYSLIDKLTGLTSKYLIVSLPNIFDLMHKVMFLTKNTLGGKYTFKNANSLDRHRWVMNCEEIRSFYVNHAERHSMNLSIIPVPYGAFSNSIRARTLKPVLQYVLGKDHLTHTLIGVFEKSD